MWLPPGGFSIRIPPTEGKAYLIQDLGRRVSWWPVVVPGGTLDGDGDIEVDSPVRVYFEVAWAGKSPSDLEPSMAALYRRLRRREDES